MLALTSTQDSSQTVWPEMPLWLKSFKTTGVAQKNQLWNSTANLNEPPSSQNYIKRIFNVEHKSSSIFKSNG